MGHVVSIHSYRGGTGKSNLTANIAWLWARAGKRVAVLDTDLQSPGVHMVLGLDKDRIGNTLTDYLFQRCELEDTAYDMGRSNDIEEPGALYLLPSSMNVEAIVRVVAEGYDAARLNQQFESLVEALRLDVLLLDTHPGLNRETMLSTSISDALVLSIRPDTQDFHGTAVLMQVAGRLQVPNVCLIANKVPNRLDRADLRKRLEDTFEQEVIGMLPLDEDMAMLGSRGLFVQKYPTALATQELERAATRLLEVLGESE